MGTALTARDVAFCAASVLGVNRYEASNARVLDEAAASLAADMLETDCITVLSYTRTAWDSVTIVNSRTNTGVSLHNEGGALIWEF
jgi:hypothetical protein